MQGDAVGTRLLGTQGSLHHARVFGAACLSYGGNVIDIHT
jgi:hypothetical protein